MTYEPAASLIQYALEPYALCSKATRKGEGEEVAVAAGVVLRVGNTDWQVTVSKQHWQQTTSSVSFCHPVSDLCDSR